MARGFGASASGKACSCIVKDKTKWRIAGRYGRLRDGYIVQCIVCNEQWNTKAKYTQELERTKY